MLRKGSLLPSSWYYVNGEIWILSPQFFALPFVAALGVSPLALKLGNIAAILLMVVCLTLPVQRVARSWPFSITVAAGLLTVFSQQHIDVIYEQAAYGLICAKLALLLFLSLHVLGDVDDKPHSPSRWTRWNAACYLLLLIEFATSSPSRAVAYWGVPIAIVCVLLPAAWSRGRRNFLLALTGIALVVGAAMHVGLKHYLLVVPGVGALQAVAQWPAHLGVLWAGLPLLLEYQLLPPALNPIYAAVLIRGGFLAGAALTMFLAWRKSPIAGIEAQFLARVAASMFAAVLVAVVVGVSATTPRYLVPPVLISLAAFMTALRFRLSAYPAAQAFVMILFVLAFSGGGALLAANLPMNGSAGDCIAPAGICQLRAALQQQRLHKGYATYWNANVTTLAAQGDVVVCGVLVRPRLAPARWLVSKDCFEPPQTSDRYFIALANSLTTPLDRQNVVAEAGAPDSTTNAGGYEIWIYEAGNHQVAWLQR